jgi:hypothetical protein
MFKAMRKGDVGNPEHMLRKFKVAMAWLWLFTLSRLVGLE